MFPVLLRLLGFQSIITHFSYFQKCKFNENIHMSRKTQEIKNCFQHGNCLEAHWEFKAARIVAVIIHLAQIHWGQLLLPTNSVTPCSACLLLPHLFVLFIPLSHSWHLVLSLFGIFSFGFCFQLGESLCISWFEFFRLWLAMFVPILATRWTHKLLAQIGFSCVRC